MNKPATIDRPQEIVVELPPQANLPAIRTPMEMLEIAINRNATPEALAQMMAMQERWEANQARKAFDEAMAAAKAEIPVIFKNRTVDFTSAKGRTSYRHEDLAGIARTVDPLLAKHGLSYRFRVSSSINEPVTVTCIVAHRQGHSEETTLMAGRDDTGNKNIIQQIGSTVTYLQRYTLKAALGLAASADDDGRGGAITDDQADKIRVLIAETKTDANRFLKWAGVESIPDIPASKFSDAVAMLNAKKEKAS